MFVNLMALTALNAQPVDLNFQYCEELAQKLSRDRKTECNKILLVYISVSLNTSIKMHSFKDIFCQFLALDQELWQSTHW